MKGIRTIALRLTGTKEAAEELEEMGEDTSDMIMSQSKMRDLIMNATKVASNDYKGFDIQDELGRYKSTYEIMLGLSQIWDEIQQADFKTGDNRQNLLLESIAGKNRASIAASILQNPETLQSVYEDSSSKAAGSAMEENQKYLDSISGHLAKLKNAWQEMWASAANREVINGVIDLATALLKAVDSVGLLGTAFAVFYGGAIIKGLMSANSWLVKFIASLDRLRESSTSVGELLSNIFGGNKTDTDSGNGFFKGLAQINKNREKSPAPETPTPEVPEGIDNSVVTEQLNAETAAQEALNQAKAEGATIQAEYNSTKQQESESSAENILEETTEKQAEELAQNKKKLEVKPFLDGEKEKQEATKETTEEIRQSAFEKAEADAQSVAGSTEVAGADEVEASAELGAAAAHDKSTASATADAKATNAAADASMKDTAASEMEKAAEGAGAGAGAGATGLVAGLTNPMTWLVALPALIGAINLGLSMWNNYQQSLVDGAHEATKAWTENKTSIDGYIQQYQDLHKQLENVNLSEAEQTDIKKQLFNLQKQITDEYGNQVKGINLVNGNLDEQIEKLKIINKEQATNNLGHNAKEYKKAVNEMEKQRTLEISSSAILSDEDFATLVKGIDGIWGRYTDQNGTEIGLTFTGDATEAEKAMDELFARLSEKKDEMGRDWEGSTYELLTNGLEKAIRKNDKTLADSKDDYNAYLEQSIYAQDGTFGTDKLSAGEVLIEAQEAVNNYNAALLSGDTSQIDKTEKAFHKVEKAANQVVKAMGDEKFKRPFDDIFDQVDQAQVEFYNTKKKFEDPKVKNIVESVLGSPQENKKSAKDIPDYLRSAAEEILDEQEKARKWGMKPLGVDPLSGISPETKFGNVDMNNRPVIEWNEAKRKRIQWHWNSFYPNLKR